MRISKGGLICSSVYAGLFLLLFFILMVSGRTNPGNSGESGILLLPFLLPWIIFLRTGSWFDHNIETLIWVVILLNTLIIYLICGGAYALFKKK
ncbi:MAG: hypothetical protein WC855_14320 [Thermodesulfovibrionales bacterium]